MMRTATQTLKIILFVFFSLQLNAQTYPVLPAPDHSTDHNAFISGSVTVNGTDQKLAGILVKLSRVIEGADNVTVSYALSDASGNFSITGQSGVSYILEYEYPANGFTATTGSPSAAFTATSGLNTAPGGGLILQRIPNTITHCNVSAPTMTDWTTTIAVPKAEPLVGAVLGSISVFSTTLSAHPLIEVTANSDSRIRSLMIGASVSLSGPGGVAADMESVKTFARNPSAQNIVLASGETLTYYDISSGLSTNSIVTGAETAYLGTGNVVFDAEALASKTITTSGGNTTSSEQTFANAGVCLTYVYNVDPLPVTLVSFSVKAEGTAVNLNWATTSETNSEKFEIQRSADAKTWNPLSSVTAQGESASSVDYRFTDVNPLNGQSFYRLKMIDRDGTFAYSRINSVKLEVALTSVNIYPNPAAQVLNVKSEGNQVKKVEIYNQAGQLVTASETASMDVSSFINGIYSVRAIYSNGLTDQGRVIIAH